MSTMELIWTKILEFPWNKGNKTCMAQSRTGCLQFLQHSTILNICNNIKMIYASRIGVDPLLILPLEMSRLNKSLS